MNSYSQAVENDKIDDFDGTRSINTKPMEGEHYKKKDFIDTSNETLAYLLYTKDKGGLEIFAISFLFVGATDFGCLSEHAGKAVILFENDSTLEISQFSQTDCSASPYTASYALLSKEERAKTLTFQETMKENFSPSVKD